MKISKYNASGNDFIIFSAKNLENRADFAAKICNRHSGIGGDGLIVIIKKEADYDFEWEFYNSDGSFASMCGNGARAASMFAYENKIATNLMSFKTGAGIIKAEIFNFNNLNAEVEISLTKPKKLMQRFSENGYEWYFYDTGVPHLVAFDKFDFNLAKKMRQKYNANVNFASLQNEILLVRTFERGVEDETLACGTGMAASFIAGIDAFNFGKNIKVMPKSGEILNLRFDDETIYFKGFVKHTFDAEFFEI